MIFRVSLFLQKCWRWVVTHPDVFARNAFVWLMIGVFSWGYIQIVYFNQVHLRNGIDLGTYTQILWNVNEGSVPPYNTIKDQVAWGDHAHFVLVLLAPLFAIAPSPITVGVLQVLSVTTSAWAMYAVARKLVRSTIFSFVVTFTYLFFFGVQYALDFDFHANVLTAAVLAWSFYAFHYKKWWLYWLLLPIGLATREDAATFYAMFAVYLLLVYRRKHWKLALTTIVISTIYFFVVVYGFMPRWNPGGTPLAYFDAPTESRNPLEIGWWIVRDPKMIWQNITQTSLARRTLRYLFQAYGFLPLGSPATYLLSLPNILARFLSPEEQRHAMNYHYSASLVSVLAYGSILTTATVGRLMRRFVPKIHFLLPCIASFVLLAGAYTSSWRDVELPVRQLTIPGFLQGRYRNPPGHDLLKGINTLIPPEDSVGTVGSLVPTFSARKEIYVWDGERDVDWIILTTLYDSWPMSREDSLNYIRYLREDEEHRRGVDFGGIHVFERIHE